MRARQCFSLSMLAILWLLPAQSVAGTDDLHADMQAFGIELPKVNKVAPDFSLNIAGGGKSSLKDYRGSLVLLHFWATWCAPCRKEMPLLYHLDKELSSEGLKIICVNVDHGEEQAVQVFMQETSPGFQTLLDPERVVRDQYEVRALPTSYLIGGDGKIIGRLIGEREWDRDATLSLFRRIVDSYASNR